MPTITINGKEYNLEDLTDNAKQQVANLQFANNEIKKLEGQIGIFKTASSVYSAALNKEIEEIEK